MWFWRGGFFMCPLLDPNQKKTMTKETPMIYKLLAMKDAYLADEDGATAIEYGLIAAGIALAISGAVLIFGDQLEALFVNMGETLEEAQNS
jgi:pilus assembly protein Flp/PilA